MQYRATSDAPDRLYFMTYKCPYCGTALAPRTDDAGQTRLWCRYCTDAYRSNGRGRLTRAQSLPTVSQLLETQARMLGES